MGEEKIVNLNEQPKKKIRKATGEALIPPLGLKPRFISETQYKNERINDILNAMERYSDNNTVIPVEWVTELRELLNV